MLDFLQAYKNKPALLQFLQLICKDLQIDFEKNFNVEYWSYHDYRYCVMIVTDLSVMRGQTRYFVIKANHLVYVAPS